MIAPLTQDRLADGAVADAYDDLRCAIIRFAVIVDHRSIVTWEREAEM
jgi:hypothetical protein